MTKLDETQDELLKNVARAKARTVERLTEVDAEYEAAKYDAEAPLRQAVLDAQQGGVPIRQIGIKGLGSQDYATVRRLLPLNLEGVAEKPVKPVSSVKGSPIIEALSDNLFLITDANGHNWEFWTIDFDGHLVVERSNNTELGKETYAKPVPFEVMQTLHKRFGNADYSAIKEDK